MKNIAIVPARCGSKGIPNKNIYPLFGKPLISYCLNEIKKSLVDEFYVSTDCELISGVALECGAKIIDRPEKISQDDSPTIDCIKHALENINHEKNDLILVVQATSPLINHLDINKVIEKFTEDLHDTIITVTENHNVFWELSENNSLVPKQHDLKNRTCRQKMKKTYAETGSVYAAKSKTIFSNNSLFGSRVGFVEIPKTRSFEIDDFEDIKIIESLLNVL